MINLNKFVIRTNDLLSTILVLNQVKYIENIIINFLTNFFYFIYTLFSNYKTRKYNYRCIFWKHMEFKHFSLDLSIHFKGSLIIDQGGYNLFDSCLMVWQDLLKTLKNLPKRNKSNRSKLSSQNQINHFFIHKIKHLTQVCYHL